MARVPARTGIAPKGECDAGSIKAIRWEAEDILSFILEPVGGGLMPF
jgi:hypothetical protein